MPSKKDFKYFKPCIVCGEPAGARCKKELQSKKYCSNKCSASIRKSSLSSSEKMRLQTERSYKMMHNNPEKYIKHLMQKPERKHIPLEYVLDLLKTQNGKCALSGITMTFEKKVGAPKVHTNLSIDRIDSCKGYEIGNIQLTCAVVNIMKTTLSSDELRWWCSKICSAQER